MLNMITDWLFTNGYMAMNICVVGAVVCLVIGLIEAAQDEVEALVEFYEEERSYEYRLADLNERA